MSGVRQTLRDLILLIKQDRKAQVIFGVIVLLVMWGFFGEPPRSRERVVELTNPDSGKAGMGEDEHAHDLMVRFGGKIEEQSDLLRSQQELLKQNEEKMEKYEERTAEIFKKLIERIADLENTKGSGGDDGNIIDADGGDIPNVPDITLESFGDLDKKEPDVPPPPAPIRQVVIGAGDSVRVRLIAAVDAPTDGTPYPVLLELIDDVAGPDNSTLPLGGARIIAAAQGSLVDQRVLFRLTQLNIRYPDGSRNVLPVDGWVVGEDGLHGMEGYLIDPLGKSLLGALIGGSVEGFGEGLKSSNTNTYYNPYGGYAESIDDAAEYAVGAGISSAGEKYARFIEERSKLLVPHVRVLSGRKANAVFSKSVVLNGLYDALEKQQEQALFVSLD